MPAKLSVIGNPITMLQMEIVWRIKPEEREAIVLDVLHNKFYLMTVLPHQHVLHDYNKVSHVIVARWDGQYWRGQLHWASFANYFTTDSATIWMFSRFLVNIQYENLIIDHARSITTDTVARWHYVGQSGVQTRWSLEPDGHPTYLHSSPKEG